MAPSEKDMFVIFVIVGRIASKISFFATIEVRIGSSAHDVLDESMMILRMYAVSTSSKVLKVDSQESWFWIDIGGAAVSARSELIISIFESKKW